MEECIPPVDGDTQIIEQDIDDTSNENMDIYEFNLINRIEQSKYDDDVVFSSIEDYYNNKKLCLKLNQQKLSQFHLQNFAKLQSIELTELQNNRQKIKQLKHLDFTIFQNLERLSLGNTNIKIILPKSIFRFSYYSFKKQSCRQNFDFSQHLNLKQLIIRNCKIDNLIILSSVQYKVSLCDIIQLNIPGYDGQCIKKLKLRDKTCINDPSQSFAFWQYKRVMIFFGICNTVKCLALNNIKSISKLKLCGIEKIIYKDQDMKTPLTVFDFSTFQKLKQVILRNIECKGMRFSNKQQVILLDQLKTGDMHQRKNKIQFLDFSQCQYESCCINGYIIQYVKTGKQLIHFRKCQIKIIDLRNVINDNKFHDIFGYYKKRCKYIIYQQNTAVQSILHKCQNSLKSLNCFIVSKSFILEIKINHIQQKIIDLYNE